MHNLFGDTNIVHVDVDSAGRPKLRHLTRGDRVQDVLGYVDYVKSDLLRELQRRVEAALDHGRITYEESAQISRRYEAGLRGYTYLTRESELAPHPKREAVPR